MSSNIQGSWIKLIQRCDLPEDDRKAYGLHSLRISTATNASYGCGELEIQRLGRWKSVECARSYIQLEEFLAKSSSIFLG